MPIGGLHPYPKRNGGGVPRLQRLVESLDKQRGTGIDTTDGSPAHVENVAYARALDASWGTNERLANQSDPDRMTGNMIPRWERILGIPIVPSDSDNVRRRRIKAKRTRRAGPVNVQAVDDAMTQELGDVFVQLELRDPSNAVIWWDGGTPNADPETIPFYSNIAAIVVKVQKLSGMTEGEFYAAVAKLGPRLDVLLPAWATWSWYRVNSAGTRGFLLDDLNNLDNEAFGV